MTLVAYGLTSYTLLPIAADYHTKQHRVAFSLHALPTQDKNRQWRTYQQKRMGKKVPPSYAGVTPTCTVLPTRKQQLKHN